MNEIVQANGKCGKNIAHNLKIKRLSVQQKRESPKQSKILDFQELCFIRGEPAKTKRQFVRESKASTSRNGSLIHSDRGSQYCSHDYQKLLTKNGFICSMSKRGDCYDNASMESWNHSFKVEAIHGEKFLTRADAKRSS